MADIDLQDVHDTLVAIAYEAGQMILNANPSDIDQGTKLNCKLDEAVSCLRCRCPTTTPPFIAPPSIVMRLPLPADIGAPDNWP